MIQSAIERARKRHRRQIEQLYDGICTVYEKRAVFDPETKVTRSEETAVFEEEPCRLSFSNSPAAADANPAAAVSQTVKLFLAPEKEVKPGSKIVVTQNGITESYAQSGRAAVYPSHQEITLELWKGYA